MTDKTQQRLNELEILIVKEQDGVFVPCKVKLANGKEIKLNVAMRNDNPWNIWTLDGGI